MIWESIWAMTVIDLLIIAVIGVACLNLCRYRKILLRRRTRIAALTITFGLLVGGAFHSIDLFIMHALPLLTSMDVAMAIMPRLHLDYGWLIEVVVTGTIVLGFVLLMFDVGALVTRLEQSESKLPAELDARKEAENALQESRNLLRLVIDTIPATINLKDRDGRFILINSFLANLYGMSVEQMEGRTGAEISLRVSYDERHSQEQDRIIFDTGQPLAWVEEDFELEGGSETWLVTKAPIKDEQGETTLVLTVAFDISDRKQAEWALRESEARIRQAQHIAKLGYWDWSSDDQRLRPSTEMAEIFGIAHEPCEGGRADALGLVHPDDRERYRAATGDPGEPAEPYEVEYRILRPDGEIRYILEIGEPAYDAGGNPVGEFGTVQDITERKLAEATVRELNARFRAFLDNVPEAISLKDMEGRYLLVNAEFERMVGLAGEEIHGKTDSEVFPWDTDIRSDVVAHERAVLESKSAIAQERENALPDGSVHSMIIMKFPVLDVKGDVVAIGTTNVNITERKRAEEALKESERTLAAAQRIAGLGHWLWDEVENRIITVSEQLARIFGVEMEKFPRTSEGWFAFIHPDDRDRAAAEIERCIANQSGFDLEYRIVRNDGQIRFVRDLSEPLFDDDGRFVRSLGTLLDITERKLAEEALHGSETRLDQLQVELAHAARLGAMGEMASALAHELNQPLTAIMNYLQAGQRALDGAGTSSSVRIDDVMAKAIAQAERAAAIIRGLRRFIDVGDVERTECDLNDLVKEAVALAIVGAPDGVDLTLELSDRLPPVSVDRIQVQQVVLNLVRNGVDAMVETTERKLTVRTGRDRDGGAEITVRDSGMGVPSHVADRLFEPFVTTKTGGMGIGLSISRSIVEDHGGELWVTPNREGGATFHFTIAGGSQSNDEQAV